MNEMLQHVKSRQQDLTRWLSTPVPASRGEGDTFDLTGVSLRNLAQVDEGRVLMQDPDSSLVETDAKKMSARFLVSSVNKDRHGDVVLPQGCKAHLKSYDKNPVVFFGHKSWGFPVGSARDPNGNGMLALDVADDMGIYSTVYFHGKTKESEDVYRLVEAKELRAASIGFMPLKGRVNKRSEASEDQDAPKNQVKFEPYITFLFEEWELYEWSIVAVPANSDCIAMRLSKGFGGRKLAPLVEQYLQPYAAPLKVWANGYVPEPEPAPAPVPEAKVEPKQESPEEFVARMQQMFLDFRKEILSAESLFLAKLPAAPVEVKQESKAAPASASPHTEVLKQILADVKKLDELQCRNEKSLRRITGRID